MYAQYGRKIQSNKLAPEIRKLGDTGSQASDVYAYGHILEDLSVIRCLPTGEREKRTLYSGAGIPSRPLRISIQGSFRNQESNNNAKFIKVSFRVLNYMCIILYRGWLKRGTHPQPGFISWGGVCFWPGCVFAPPPFEVWH